VAGEEVKLSGGEWGPRPGQSQAANLDVVAERGCNFETQLITTLYPNNLRPPVRDPHPRYEQQPRLTAVMHHRSAALHMPWRHRIAAPGRGKQHSCDRRQGQQHQHDGDQSAGGHASSLDP
jgi:hypothetical protein